MQSRLLSAFSTLALRSTLARNFTVETMAKTAVAGKQKRAKKPKDAPKRAMSAFMFYANDVRPQVRQKQPGLKITEVATLIGKMWAQVSDKQREKYEEKAREDKDRYQREMQTYVPPPTEKGKGGRRKKDPSAPKRAMSGFMYYANDIRPKLQKAHPELKITEIASKIGVLWKTLTDKDKIPFAKLAAADKARYDEEMSAYRETQ